MAVFRVERNKGYTVMSNHHLRNKELSLKAKGLLSQMLSLPEDWDYTLAGLSFINREKIDAIREAVKELERAGYIVRSRERDEKGRLRGADYVIFEQPQTPPVSDLPTLENPTLDNPTLEKPTQKKPTLENPTQLNKDIQKTNLPKKEKSNIDLSSTDSIPIHSLNPLPYDGEAAEPPERKRKEATDAYSVYEEIIKDNIEYDHFVRYGQVDKDRLDEIVSIILETVCSKRKTIRIAGDDYPAELVKAKFMKLNSSHIDFTPFRNIMNEYYARDTSRKIRSTFQSKGKSGKHVTGLVIYGYLWNETRDQWLVDEYSAGIVKRIFQMTIDGMGPYQIANKLKEEKVLIPSAYLATHNEGVNKSKAFKDVYGWGSSTVVNILDKREYLGHTVNFKTRKHFKDKKSHYVPEDEWLIFENTHEAIIDQETFDLAQKVRSKVRRYPDGWGDVAPLTGLMYCADCGGKMYVHRFNNGKRISQYTCSKYTKVPCGTLCPTQHRINESVVLELISDLLKAIAEYAKHDRAEFIRVVQEAQDSHIAADVKRQKTKLTAAKQRLNELEVLLCKIYEDNILGKLPDARYATLDAQYAKEQDTLKAEIATLENFLANHEKNKKSAERFISLIEKYENFDNLTIAMLNEFIDKILVHERDRKGSIQTTQEIEIYFNFVGKFVPPHFMEVELTPEQQEELRKREERKDRLHQNYLKRKASGAQKRYEDKIKAKKKAEMDAKKNALRAEDVAKGVFIPVSNMPKLEPQIAPQKGA